MADDNPVSMVDAGPLIVATVRLAGVSPAAALTAFTDPVVLARWWRGDLTAELLPGGEYTVRFPAIAAVLTGQVISYEPGVSLVFSWAWDGDDGPPSTVTVRTSAATGGAALIIEHGPHFNDDAGRRAHTEHWDGWEYFLPRLPEAVGAAGDQGP